MLPTGQTSGLTTYSFSGISNDFTGTMILEGYVNGYSPSTYKFYGGKVFGVFGKSYPFTSASTISIIDKVDITEKTNFNTATFDVTTDGVEIFLTVTGESGDTINWNVTLKQTYNQ